VRAYIKASKPNIDINKNLVFKKLKENGIRTTDTKHRNRKIYKTTGWPKKVSHYQVSSLDRIKNRH